jgi:hypothetical protein
VYNGVNIHKCAELNVSSKAAENVAKFCIFEEH